MCGLTRAETLRAILGNLKQHDFDVNGKFQITEEEGAVLQLALEDYKGMCEAGDFFYVGYPEQVFNSDVVVKRGNDGKISS